MASGFQYFNSSDSGAPVLTAQVGSMIALLDWVLVTKGGWAKAYTGTNLAAYRSNTGNRFYLRIDDTQTNFTRVRAYRSMTNINTGTSQFPTTTQFGSSGVNFWGWMKGYMAGTDARRYWGVRTDRYFVLVVEVTSPSEIGYYYRHVYAFGDFPSAINGDAHNTLVIGIPDANIEVYNGYLTSHSGDRVAPSASLNTSYSNTALSGTPNGSVISPIARVATPGRGANSAYTAAVKLGNTFFFNPTSVICTNSATTNNGVLPRGKLANVSLVYGGGSSAPSVDYPVTDLTTITVGSRTFLPILEYTDGSTSYSEAVLLEITDTDGAL